MSYQIEIRHLNYFLAVAEELHFRRAADKLFISQPGLSRQIKQLEADLGVALFERNNRNVTLTKAGEYLQKEVSKHLKVLDTILNTTKRIHEGVDGNLNFGYVGSAMQHIIPNLLVKIRNECPNIHFNLKEMDNQKQLDNLQTQEIDIGFVRLERVPNDIEITPIEEDTFSLVLPANHTLNSGNFTDLSQLRDEAFIMFDPSYSSNYYQKIMQIFDYCGFTPIVSHRTIHASSIYKLVEHNFGISIVPSSLQIGNTTNVKFIELKKIPQRTNLSAVWSKNNSNPVLAKILEFI
ncbi:LysR family transcriptional regulator [Lutibacter sp. A80]|uniref:LysR family transcriptional regulator n=1 Tax=Lutibacter sp. A80 TaxID=2918453 RepID=UPI001F0635C9|nr:LysR family transcriptional regulator [Lutibacter sp. A80]UMB60302.1 LysR family transcriptional regulator [Lutibacter sp. A80]